MKLKYTITLLLIAASSAACNDWLDIAPKDKVLEDKQYSSEDNIYSAMNGLYRELTGEHLYGGQLSQTTIDMMGHCYTYPFNRPSEGDQSMPFYALGHFEYTNDNVKTRFTNIWKKSYETLLHINTFIERLGTSPAVISEKNKNILLGEAYGMRAWLHFDLFRIFGPRYRNRNRTKILPYNNRADVVLNQNDYEEKTYRTADEYLDLLLADINKALQLLEGNDPVIDDANSITNNLRNDNFFRNRNRRMNYYAVKGLQARLLMYIGKENEAAKAAKTITDMFGKRFKWVDVSKLRKEYNFILFSEVIFGLNNLDMNSRGKTFYAGSDLRTAYLMDYNNLMKNILNYPGNILSNMTDIRAWQWLSSNVVSSTAGYSFEGTYVSYRYSVNTSDLELPAIKDFQPLMRITEMCYIRAEVALNAGDKIAAIDLLNEVLMQRGLTAASLLHDNMSEETIRAHIEREYYREFFGEGQVFFYHKRLGSSSMFKGYNEGRDNVSPESYVVPIPEAETLI